MTYNNPNTQINTNKNHIQQVGTRERLTLGSNVLKKSPLRNEKLMNVGNPVDSNSLFKEKEKQEFVEGTTEEFIKERIVGELVTQCDVCNSLEKRAGDKLT